ACAAPPSSPGTRPSAATSRSAATPPPPAASPGRSILRAVSVEGIPLLAAVLLLGASAFVAWEVGASHPARLVVQILVGAGLGGLPAALIFDQCKRWRPDFGFMALMVGFAIGISFGTLATGAAGRSGAGRRALGFFGAS